MQFVLISETKHVSNADLYRLRPALELNARHAALAWGEHQPAIDVTTKPQPGCHIVVFVDGDPPPGSLAMHWYEPHLKVTASRVWVEAATGLATGRASVCELAGHEILEAMINPFLDRWYYRPGFNDQAAVEICDMVQTSYDIDIDGERWPAANFVLPSWFFPALGRRYDYSGELQAPGQIGVEGYAILRNDNKVWLENSRGQKPFFDGKLGKSKEHPLSRTRMLLGLQ